MLRTRVSCASPARGPRAHEQPDPSTAAVVFARRSRSDTDQVSLDTAITERLEQDEGNSYAASAHVSASTPATWCANPRVPEAGTPRAAGGCNQNYPRHIHLLKRGKIRDGGIEFSRAPSQERDLEPVAYDASTAALIRPAKASASFFAARVASGRRTLPKPWPSKVFEIVMRVAPSPAGSRS